MSVLREYEITKPNGRKVTLMLGEKRAQELGAKLVTSAQDRDVASKEAAPANKARTAKNVKNK